MDHSGFRYLAHFEAEAEEDGGFTVTFPDVPEAITYGEDRDEALAMAQEALALALSLYVEDGESLPKPAAVGKDLIPVEVSALDQSKLVLAMEMRKAGVSRAELARRLRVDEREASRIVDVGFKTRFGLVEAAFRALGRRLRIEVEAAA